MSFDYRKNRELPEVLLRLEYLEQRLKQTTKNISQVEVLEVGIGSGNVSALLCTLFPKVTCVDPDEETCRQVEEMLTEEKFSAKFVKDYVENAELEEYDCIILQNILEHVKDPAKVLSKLKKHLKTNGRMYISIPLANSFHRYLGVMEGIINDVKELAPSDHEYGHYWVYTPELFREHVAKAGLKIAHFVPFYLKPLPTGTLQSLSLDAHRQLFKLGEKFPEYAAYLYAEIE